MTFPAPPGRNGCVQDGKLHHSTVEVSGEMIKDDEATVRMILARQ